MTNLTAPISRSTRESLLGIKAELEARGIVRCRIDFFEGGETIVARNAHGEIFRSTTYESNGYFERTLSECARLKPSKRKIEAKRMHRSGFTQQQIAERLGCSQKTISNDLSQKSNK